MSPRSRLRTVRIRSCVVLLLALFAPLGASADVVEASSTTIVSARKEYRDGQAIGVVPIYELLSVSARDVTNPYVDGLQIVMSTWGEVDAQNARWDWFGTGSRLKGDLDLLYIQGEFAKRALMVQLGRMFVADGTSRMTQLDGGQARLVLPFGLGVSGYAGLPVAARFSERGGSETWNPIRGDFAAGGRVFYVLPRWGEVGASLAWVSDHGDPSRQDVGFDLRVTPWRSITVLGNGFFSMYEHWRMGQANAAVLWQAIPALQLGLEYRHIEPDLFLPRDSILAVFASASRDEAGFSVHAGPFQRVTLDGDYHYVVDSDRADGHRLHGRVTWQVLRATAVGADVDWLYDPLNGYVFGRLFASQDLDRLRITADIQDAKFSKAVNAYDNSFLATATVGYRIGGGWAALVAGSAGVTPLLSSRFDVMAKLAYNQSYRLREVR